MQHFLNIRHVFIVAQSTCLCLWNTEAWSAKPLHIAVSYWQISGKVSWTGNDHWLLAFDYLFAAQHSFSSRLQRNRQSKYGIHFDEITVLRVINKIKPKLSYGPDGIPPLVIKKVGPHIAYPLARFFWIFHVSWSGTRRLEIGYHHTDL